MQTPPDFATKPAPSDWPRLSTAIYYADPAAAIEWLCRVFGFDLRLKVEGDGGAVVHSELLFGSDGLIMVADANVAHRPGATHCACPTAIGGKNTQNVMLFVDDVDAHCAHARGHGALVTMEPTTSDYGEDFFSDRSYEVVDLEGHRWWFVQRLRSPVQPSPRGTVKAHT